MLLDWLLIGGGIHGVHVAVRLLAEAGVPRERLRLVDPSPRLLARWRTSTEATGMAYLRSPSVHHLDVAPYSLDRFAGKRKDRDPALFTAPYDRPALALFNAHCDHVIDSLQLEELHVRDRASRCVVSEDRAVVRLEGGDELVARNVVLALGQSEQPCWPSWAPREHPLIRHLFHPSGAVEPSVEGSTVAVVGGGISAAQIAVRLGAHGHHVLLVSRHKLRKHQFDADPGWLGPKHMADFLRVRSLKERRAIIERERHRGSLPPDTRGALRRSIEKGRVTWHEAEVEALADAEGRLRLDLSTGETIDADRLLLATGFASERPGGAMVDELVEAAALPCADCGYPVVDAALRWHPRVRVTGPLAELELGPVARTIAGARRAADRIVDTVLDDASPASCSDGCPWDELAREVTDVPGSASR